MRSPRSRNQGFTFVEMALTLFSVGFLLSAVPTLLNKGQEAVTSAPGAAPAAAAEFALKGFIYAYSRLPCPSATLEGLEDCSRTRGFVPYRTLHLAGPVTNSGGHAFAYSILGGQNNHLGKLEAKYTPQYLKSTTDYWVNPPTENSEQTNGLDFCAKLRTQSALPVDAALLNVRSWRAPFNGPLTNVAWVLVDPGSRNAGGGTGSNTVFDGDNDPLGSDQSFESPSRAQSETYDDKVRVATLHQLFGEMRCAELLAGVSAAAREADFANDNWRVRQYLYDFRTYELKVREQKKIQADNTKLLAIFDLSMNVALSALDLGVGLASGSGAVAIGISAINAIAAIAMSVTGFQDAEQGVTDAIEEVTEGGTRKTTAKTDMDSAETFRGERIAALRLLDQRGWFP